MKNFTLKDRKEFLDNIKPKEGFDFKFTGNFDVEELSKYLNTFSDEWKLNTSNQESYLSQKESNSYFITEVFNSDQNDEPFINGIVTKDPQIIELIVIPIIYELEKLVGGKYAKSLLAKLPAGKRIFPHYDQGGPLSTYMMVIRRFHIVITTNDKVSFRIGNITMHLTAGECWEINQNIIHEVWNDGDSDRIHLIVDIFPYRWL